MNRTSLVALTLIAQLAGCSVLSVRGPADGARRTGPAPVACTMSSPAPTIDFLLAATGLAVAVVAGTAASIPGEAIGNSDSPGGNGVGVFLVGTALLSLPWALSGLVGSSRIGACEDANAPAALSSSRDGRP